MESLHHYDWEESTHKIGEKSDIALVTILVRKFSQITSKIDKFTIKTNKHTKY